MSRTDKDVPFRVRKDRDEVGHSGRWGSGDSGFRRSRKALKRQGNKYIRRNAFSERYAGRCPWYQSKSVRAAIFFG